jgi:hypothetical protein
MKAAFPTQGKSLQELLKLRCAAAADTQEWLFCQLKLHNNLGLHFLYVTGPVNN